MNPNPGQITSRSIGKYLIIIGLGLGLSAWPSATRAQQNAPDDASRDQKLSLFQRMAHRLLKTHFLRISSKGRHKIVARHRGKPNRISQSRRNP